MKKPMIWAAGAFGLLTLSAVAMTVPAIAQQPNVQRKVLMTQDLTIPGYQAVMVSVEIPAGGREGRHTHPAAVAVYVIEGALSVDYEGRPTTAYKAGDSFYIEPGKIHEGINNSGSAVKLIATFVAEKGKPLTSPAQ